MGLLHGLGGGGALAFVVLATLPSPAAAFLYILVFGAGSTAGMLAFSGLLGIPFALAGARRRWDRRCGCSSAPPASSSVCC